MVLLVLSLAILVGLLIGRTCERVLMMKTEENKKKPSPIGQPLFIPRASPTSTDRASQTVLYESPRTSTSMKYDAAVQAGTSLRDVTLESRLQGSPVRTQARLVARRNMQTQSQTTYNAVRSTIDQIVLHPRFEVTRLNGAYEGM